MTEKNIDLLVVVLDANPVWWGQVAAKNPEVYSHLPRINESYQFNQKKLFLN